MVAPDGVVARCIEDTQAALAAELRRARRAQRMSQGELARRLVTPVTQQAVAGYESGAIVLSVPRLLEFCFALGVSPVEMVCRAVRPLRTVLDTRVLGSIVRPELASLRAWALAGGGRAVVFDTGVRDALSRLSGLSGAELDTELAPALAQRPVG